MGRTARVLLLRVLAVLLMLEVGLRVEWYVREHQTRTESRERAARVLAFGNSLTAGYPSFLRAEISERLPRADVVVEEFVWGSTPSNELVRLLEQRLRASRIDVVIAMMGAYDHHALGPPAGPAASPPSGGLEPRVGPGLKPMFVSVLLSAGSGWAAQLKDRGLRGLLRPDDRPLRPVFQRAPAPVAESTPPPAQSPVAPPPVPNDVEQDWGERRRVVTAGNTAVVAERFAQSLAGGLESNSSSKEFKEVKQWYRWISKETPGFIDEVLREVRDLDAPGAEPMLRFALAFRRGEYEQAFRLASGLPYRWFLALSMVHAGRASPAEFERILDAVIRVRGAGSFAARLQLAQLLKHDAADEAVGFLAAILAGRWPETEPEPAERRMLDKLAQRRLPLLLAARSECDRARTLGLPPEVEERVRAGCIKRTSAPSESDLYTEMARSSYRRLYQLSLEYGFTVVAVQYPGRPVDELVSYLPADAEIPVVDNYASFVAAVEEHTHLGVYTSYRGVGKVHGGHLTALGNRLLARNILEVLLLEGLLPVGDE